MKKLKPKLLFFLLLGISCNNNGQSTHSQKDSTATNATKANSIAGNFSNQQTIKFDAEKITSFFTKYPQLATVKKELDSLMMCLDGFNATEISEVNIATGIPRVYEFSPELKLEKANYLDD